MKLLRVFLLCLLCIFCLGSYAETNKSAKYKKIKYSQNISYYGQVVDKLPKGNGLLTINSVVDKKAVVLSISGDFVYDKVWNATVIVNGSTTIVAEKLSYQMKLLKDCEQVELSINDLTLTTPKTPTISDLKRCFMIFDWNKETDKDWCIDVFCYGTVIITSQFIDCEKALSIINASHTDIAKQKVNFVLDKIKTADGYDLRVKLKEALWVELANGTKIDLKPNISFTNNNILNLSSSSLIKEQPVKTVGFSYTFPNGNLLVDSDGDPLMFKMEFEDGIIEKPSNNKNIIIRFNNKKEYSGTVQSDNLFGTCKKVSDVQFKTGKLSNPDGTFEEYLNGRLVKSAVLQPTGYLLITEYSKSDGSIIRTISRQPIGEIVTDYVNGDVVTVKYPLRDGGYYIKKKDGLDVLYNPSYGSFIASIPGGLVAKKEYTSNMSYEDFIFKSCKLNNIVFVDGKIDFEKSTPKRLGDLRMIAKQKDFKIAEVRSGNYVSQFIKEDGKVIININGHGKQVGSAFYVQLGPNLFLSYPKSQIIKGYSTWEDKPRMQLEPGEYCFGTIDQDKQKLVWLYNPTTTINGCTYGTTIGLYVVENNDIIKDLSEAMKSGNNRAFKEVRPAPKKKTYHERGRMEDCGVCFGTGKGWQGGYCVVCGGKGWYIEHYW